MLLDLQGNVLFTSHALEPLLGYGRDELTSRSLTDLVHEDDLERAQAALAETVTKGRPSLAHTRVRHRDGRWIPVEAKGTAVLDERGAPTQVLAVVREVG